ncbi:MAG: hypothetical protein HOM68_24610 [Gemmatimonadetes bacterium]|jgi:hypothetical protein|nr:hypothetical protein [Gemmatimonadota bacterium]MBT5059752.1 hypothetical protein [Gemmatimonadota bacterium]MBT5143052.1 hypothetical protein [Gemmatimonadota bacterium]MBT5588318.1 hypothetical protein [Gemmatimonadota bacterium]MBT5962717.1 hypothetical protein [Gemmatimonadota bacterium]
MATIYETYDDLLADVLRRSQDVTTLGNTVDGAPIVVARGGGDKTPGVFITAGSHSTEHAGVSAAVQLIDELDTEHQVFVVPTRDPVGHDGFAHALSLGLGELPSFDDFDELEELMRSTGDILFEDDDFLLVLIGDYGYASARPETKGEVVEDGETKFRAGPKRKNPQGYGYGRMRAIYRDQPEILAPLLGRRVYQPAGQIGVEGTNLFDRAYTLIVSLEGEILHINRFHDTAWAPVEPRVTRQLLDEVRPGISFDLHESAGMDDRFWLSARTQPDPESQIWEQKAATATIQAIAASGAALATEEDAPSKWFDMSEQAVFWLDATRRGEGFNLMDYCSREYGLAFGTEMGMFGTFDGRVDMALTTVRTAVSVFEERYR